MLAAKQDPEGAPRELQEIMEDEFPDHRELGHNNYYSYGYNNYGYNNYYSYGHKSTYSYWDRIKRYCKYYPSSCFNYCDWYPSWCDEFCEVLPEFCDDTPEDIKTYFELYDVYDELGIESLYGPDWADQVVEVCEKVSTKTCTNLQMTVNLGRSEMSVNQLDHMYQQVYTKSFSMF